MFYLIGSRALEIQVPEFCARENSDWDIICHSVDRHHFTKNKQHRRIEFHNISELDNRWFCIKYADQIINLDGIDVHVINLHGLAAIKRSHLWRLHKWDQHITQYHQHLAKYMTPGAYKDAMTRQQLTIDKFSRGNPNLNQSNKDFFDDAVEKKYDHDTLHEMVAYYDAPLYTRLKHDEKRNKAWCERDLWEELSHDDKCRCVAEESYVIAAERFLIPKNWDTPFMLAYHNALKKVCTTLCSGWFRDFAIDNFVDIRRLYDCERLVMLKQKLEVYDEKQCA